MPLPKYWSQNDINRMTELEPNGRVGHTHHTGGYSGSYSWWAMRDQDRGFWYVCGHDHGFCKVSQRAVTDDFGNLVPVGDKR